MFEAMAAEVPERIALRQGADEMSFAALRQQADAVAAALVAGRRHARRPCRHRRAAIDTGRRRHPRGAAGARRLRSARSGGAAGAARFHPEGLRRQDPADGRRRRVVTGAARRHGAAGRRHRRRRWRRRGARVTAAAARRPGLSDLHVRFDRRAQGSPRRSCRPGRLPVLGRAALRPRRSPDLSPVHLAGLRPDGHQPLPAAHHRRHARDLPGARRRGRLRRRQRRRGEHRRLHQAHALAPLAAAPHRPRGLTHPPDGRRRRRSQDLARVSRQRATGRTGRDPQRVRADRSCRRLRRASLRPRFGHRRQRADRIAGRSRPGRDPERVAIADA